MSQFDSPRWFLDTARYFQAFGFYESVLLTEEGIMDEMESYWGNDWREYLAGVLNKPSADQWLLIADKKRVWWYDLEGVYRGANFYVEVLNEWATISRGQFTPEQIQETWHGEGGPVEVNFVLNGNRHMFMHRSGDFLEHEILQLINQALSNKSFSFEVAIDYGDSNWIAMLDQTEKQRLMMERGWHFLW